MAKAVRPKVTTGTSTRVETGCGKTYVTCNNVEGKPFEVFGSLGKAGECAKCQSEGLTRMITLALRCGATPEECIKQLKGIGCPTPAFDEEFGTIKSCPDAIAKAMARAWAPEILKQVDVVVRQEAL
jgi:ribonucleoside-diphosphate reductase alpha chain